MNPQLSSAQTMKRLLLSVTVLLAAVSAQAAVYTGVSAAYTFGDEEMMYLVRVGTSFWGGGKPVPQC